MILLARWQAMACIIVWFAGLPAFGQVPFHTWLDRFPNSNNQSGPATVEITFDGGYVVAGNVSAQGALNITKFTRDGNMEWSKDFGPAYGCAAFAAIQLKDSGYVATGLASQTSIYVVRTDASGNLLWSKTYGAGAGNWIHQTLDGGLVIGGNTGSGYQQSTLIKTDINGNVQWRKNYTYNNYNLVLSKGVQLSDSSYMLGCRGGNGMVLIKTDKNGNIQWTKEHNINTTSYSFGMRRTRDGGYIMVGTDSYGPGRGPGWHAIKVDSAGNQHWSKLYTPTFANSYGYCYDVEELDYGYALVGYFYDSPPSYSTSYLVKIDPSGSILWNVTFNEQYWDWMFSVKQTADKGLVMWGHTQIQGSQQRGSLVKTDSLGQGTCKFSTQAMKDTIYSSVVTSPSISAGNGVTTSAVSTSTYSGQPVKQYYPCNVPPVAKYSASDTAICAGTTITFTDQSTNGPTAWQWTFTGGSPANSPLQNPSVTYNSVGVYTVKLVATNSSGSDSLTKTGYITVTASGQAGTVTGNPDSLCAGGTSQLQVTGISGNIRWQSSVQQGMFTDINGATATTYSTPALSQTTYYRTISGSGACADTSNEVEVLVHPAPASPVLSSPDTLICTSDSALISVPGTYSSYLWNNGATGSSIYTNQAGGHWVTVTDANGCSAVSSRVNIGAYPVPSVSVIVQSDTLASFNATAYQWYLNDQAISGATLPVYVAQQTGNYSVEITDTNGCKARSTDTYIEVTGLHGITADAWFVYPNPFTNSLFISAAGTSTPVPRIEIWDVLGQLVLYKEHPLVTSVATSVDVSHLPAGAYYIRLQAGGAVYSRPVIKQ